MSDVYAAFDSHQAVTAAIDQLQLYGFSPSSIRLEMDTQFRDPPSSLGRGAGFLSAVQNFIAKVGGTPNPQPHEGYEQIIRRGGAVLAVAAVTTVEERAARQVLKNAGSVEVEPSRESRSEQAFEADFESVDPRGVDPSDRTVAVGGLPLHVCAPSGREASEADLRSFQSGSFEVRQLVEVITLSKTARVIEELRVNKSIEVHTATIDETLRGTSVTVEDLPADQRAVPRE